MNEQKLFQSEIRHELMSLQVDSVQWVKKTIVMGAICKFIVCIIMALMSKKRRRDKKKIGLATEQRLFRS